MNEVTKMILDNSSKTLDDLVIDNGSGQYMNAQPERFHDLTEMYREFLSKLKDSDFEDYEKLLIFKSIVESVCYEPVLTHEFTSDIIATVDVIMTETYRMLNAEIYDTLSAIREYMDNLITIVIGLTWGDENDKTRYVPAIWNILGDTNNVSIIRLGVVPQAIIEYRSRHCRYSLLDYNLQKAEKDDAITYVLDITPAYEAIVPAIESLLPTELAILTFRWMLEEYIVSLRNNIEFTASNEGWGNGDDDENDLDGEFLLTSNIEVEDNAERIAGSFHDYMYKNHYEKIKKYNMSSIMKTICETQIFESMFETFVMKCIFPVIRPTILGRKFIFIPVEWYVTHNIKQFKIALRIML